MTATRVSRRARMIALVVATIVATVGVLAAVSTPEEMTPQELQRSVSQTVRCPVCVGESIADSTAPVAVAMRDEVGRQLDAGRSPDEIREWFAQTYGDGVLLVPPLGGAGLLMWAVPAALIAAAVIALVLLGVRGRRRRSAFVAVGILAVAALAVVGVSAITADGAVVPAAEKDRDPASALGVLETTAKSRPGDADVRLAHGLALHASGDVTAATAEIGAAGRLRPSDPHIAFLHASLLLDENRPDEAAAALDTVLALRPDHGAALLARGMMLWREGDERARELLREFVRVMPDDPAAPGVRDLLNGTTDG